jgi:predicted Rossmann-fold nucleotide-binding protein
MAAYPRRDTLYSAEELIDGFHPADTNGFAETWDFRQFVAFKRDGGPAPLSKELRLQQADHDADIAAALSAYIATAPPLVGIMGSHALRRDAAAYRELATLARRLTREGLLVVTGGGPGAMEAAHLGAACAEAKDDLLEKALDEIATAPELPNLTAVVNKTGEVVGDAGLLRQATAWLGAALEVRRMLPDTLAPSLAIPTWLYGEEPAMPFAAAYAKYFQNSIREEALVTQARSGIVYAQGGGGTLREIFEDVEDNYYVSDAASFTPMVFFDGHGYWSGGSADDPGVRLDAVLAQVFARAHPVDTEAYLAKVVFTTDLDRIVELITAQIGSAEANRRRILRGEPSAAQQAKYP